jgi:multicomponent Na+:H+ antiporter subunit D
MVAPVALLAALTLAIGLYAEPLAVVADRAATELLLPETYVNAVLQSPPTTADALP